TPPLPRYVHGVSPVQLPATSTVSSPYSFLLRPRCLPRTASCYVHGVSPVQLPATPTVSPPYSFLLRPRCLPRTVSCYVHGVSPVQFPATSTVSPPYSFLLRPRCLPRTASCYAHGVSPVQLPATPTVSPPYSFLLRPRCLPRTASCYAHVSCYVRGVSTVKFSADSTEFFSVVLQTGREEFQDAVVFSPGRRRAFLQAGRDGTPLCLNTVEKGSTCIPGFRGTSDFDVIVSNGSDASVTTVPFAARSRQSQQRTSLKEVITMRPGRKVSLVEAEAVSLSPSARTVNVRGAEREVRNCSFSDETAQITLQLWERHLVQLRSSYTFTELSTTTSLNSTCSPIGDLAVPDCAGGSADARLSSIDDPIPALEIRGTMKCSLCGRRQDTFDSKIRFPRCQQCRMMQKTATYNRQLSATLNISADGEEYTLTAVISL
ncbi:hypothetical protein NFI96_014423, partial [Prochilodus magdalenae]